MKYGVIDIGSNSIRLMMSDGIHTISKEIETTQLSQDLAKTNKLREDAMNRSINAIINLYNKAKKLGAEKIYAFATEAVRSASNREVFLNRLLDKGIYVDVVPASKEPIIGFLGAYQKGKVCVVDIGGASTEFAVGTKKGIEYAKSVPIGIVRIKDNCGENLEKIETYIDLMLENYKDVPNFDEILAIGGTASSFVAIKLGLDPYDSSKVDFYKLSYKDVEILVNKIYSLSFEERIKVKGLAEKRRDVIVGGGILLMKIMKYLNKDYVIVRESDNLEGYLKNKIENVDI